MDFPGGSDGKASVYNAGDLGSIPGQDDPREKEMAIHFSTLAWRIPWIEESGGLQSTGSQSRTGVSDLSTYTYPHPKRHSEQKGPTTDQSCKGDPACRRQ